MRDLFQIGKGQVTAQDRLFSGGFKRSFGDELEIFGSDDHIVDLKRIVTGFLLKSETC